MLSRALKWGKELLFPPKCMACGSFLKKDLLDRINGVLCERCLRNWNRALMERCGRCGAEYPVCRCMPKSLEAFEILGYVKLLSYEKVRMTVGKQSILYLKKHSRKEAVAFVAAELSRALSSRLTEDRREQTGVLVTYLPRSRKGVNEYGFDQSKLLAKEVARLLAVEFASVFERRRGKPVREQKRLSAVDRKKNMQSAFQLAEKGTDKLSLCQTLVILDDIVTTGSSIAGCLSLLPQEARGKTLVLSVGVAPLSKKRIK